MTNPTWFDSIVWSTPIPIEQLRVDRDRLPKGSGVYVFTNYAGKLEKNFGVLYVGKAKSLYKRVQSYLVDPGRLLLFSYRSGEQRLNSSLKHAGKVQLMAEIQQKYRTAGDINTHMWVRWHECPSPVVLEDQLIKYLDPAYNSAGRGDLESDG